MNIIKRSLALVLLLGILAGCMVGCGRQATEDLREIEDFAQAKMGIMTGSSQELIAKERFPDAELVYFSRPADMVLAVEQGKIDCYLFGSPFLATTLWENAKVTRVEEAVSHGDIAFAFPKDGSKDALAEEFNGFLQQAKEDGTIDQLKEKWLGDTEPTEHPDYTELTGENGTIRLAAVAENKPLIYQHQNRCTGLEMELLTAFARQHGYRFDIDIVPFDSVIFGMATGKYDMTSASLQVTEERAESVTFSDPYMQFDVVLVVKDDGSRAKKVTLADLDAATIGIVTGTNWDIVVQRQFPHAERKYFSSSTDTALALEQGKIDAFLADKTVYAGMRWENEILNFIDEPIETISNALILAKDGYDENLLAQLNEFIADSKTDGTLAVLDEKWFGIAEPEEHPDYTKLSGENGTLKVAVGNSMKPMAYQKGSGYSGYEVEFLTMFAEKYGYRLEPEGMAFEALIPAVSSGKCDIGACGITVTPERAESVTFTDSHFETCGVAVIRSDLAHQTDAPSDIQSLQDLKTGSVAIMVGTIWDGIAKEQLPEAERKYYSTITDMFLSIEQQKVDAILGDRSYYVSARWDGVPVLALEETISSFSCGYMLEKDTYDPVLLEQLNAFIARSQEDGTIDALCEKWFAETEPTEHPDYPSLPDENGTLKIAVDSTSKPMTYLSNDHYSGFDVELLTAFAREYGYALEIEGMTFDALIPSVSSGKYDISACGTSITDERTESVTFTDPYLEMDGVLMVNRPQAASQQRLIDKISESFEKTFIREDRWKLILDGMGVTMLISICAAVAGTLLGLGLYMLSRSDVRLLQALAKGVAKVYSRIVAGTPVVVILMILFYVVFGTVRDMSGIVVAILGFALTFGAFVYDHMTVSVGSVDPGQTEAAYALGYTKNKAFFRIVFPQAMKIFLPSYCSHAVELVKATAVVGYIAVNDLTKMGDIIRSNTYEAFFPLISTAVIYFLLTWLLSSLLGLVKVHFEPTRRSKETILKGVKTV